MSVYLFIIKFEKKEFYSKIKIWLWRVLIPDESLEGVFEVRWNSAWEEIREKEE